LAAGTSRGRADEPELGSSRMTRPTTSANASTATTTAEVRWVVIDIAKRTHAPIRRRRRSAIGPSAARLRKDRATTLRLVRLSRPLVTAVELPTTQKWPYHDGSQVKASRFRSPRCLPASWKRPFKSSERTPRPHTNSRFGLLLRCSAPRQRSSIRPLYRTGDATAGLAFALFGVRFGQGRRRDGGRPAHACRAREVVASLIQLRHWRRS
jgi:hypothetical protein